MIAVHWTDHEFMYWNQNVLLFSPLGIGVVAGMLRVDPEGKNEHMGAQVRPGGAGVGGSWP